MTDTKPNLREQYINNEIFRIGDIVECVDSGIKMKVLDRGANYVTVATETGVEKQWLNSIRESTQEPPEPEQTTESITLSTNKNFTIFGEGQLQLFGYETKNFDSDISTSILEQFSEFDDLYSQHQIVKCLDMALMESDTEHAYDLVTRVENFFTKHNIGCLPIVEGVKSDLEKRRIIEILASIAGTKVDKSINTTVNNAITALKDKYKTKTQWEVLFPFIKLAQSYGIPGLIQKIPFAFPTNEELIQDEVFFSVMEDHINLLAEEINFDDIDFTFEDSEYSDEILTEVLSIEVRNKMARKMDRESTLLSTKRNRALKVAAKSSVLYDRARRMAETMLKRKMFKKSPEELSRQEKERFEMGAMNRRALVARLAQKLVSKVRQLQNTRLHHQQHSVSHTHDAATKNIAQAAGAN